MKVPPTYGGARRGVGRLLPVVLPLLVTAPLAPPAASPIAIVDVRLLPMDGSGPIDGQSVLIEGERVRWVGPASDLVAPAGARIVHGHGRTLMPGLADMHVHLNRDDLPTYLAFGVTTVRNMWGFPEAWTLRGQIDRGVIPGPSIHLLSPGLDGPPPKWPLTQLVLDPAHADSVVEVQWRSGYRTLKLYQDLRPEVYDSIVAAARRRGMRFAGHVPHRVGLERALAADQRSLEHLSGYVEELTLVGGRGPTAWVRIRSERIPVLAAATRATGAWVCPTLAILHRMGRALPAEERAASRSNRAAMVRALHAAGVGLLVGSDAGIDVVDPGASLLEELQEFVAAGIPPLAALRMATAGAAAFLGQEGEFGVVAPGARADLLLLDGDPVADLAALEAPAGVMVRGRWFREPEPPSDPAGPAGGLTPPGAAPPARASAGATAPSP